MIRSFGAFAVVGAGLSAGGYPMTAQLPPLLWQAIEGVPEALIAPRERTGIAGSAKEVLTSGQSALEEGWRLVRAFPPVRTAFQEAFAVLDADRDPSSAHFDLARLVDSGQIEGVVSFNWDTCLERAYEHMYGVALPTGVLHKPHGDAAHPEDDWVQPDEDGQVSSEVLFHYKGCPSLVKFSVSSDVFPSVQAEAVASNLAARAGIRTAPVYAESIDGKYSLVSDRFDRGAGGARRLLVSALTIVGRDESGSRDSSYPEMIDKMITNVAEPESLGREHL